MEKATEVVYKYCEGEFAGKHVNDGCAANSNAIIVGLTYGVITLSLFTPVLYTARKNLTGHFR